LIHFFSLSTSINAILCPSRKSEDQ
jgi:hypothetical protein